MWPKTKEKTALAPLLSKFWWTTSQVKSIFLARNYFCFTHLFSWKHTLAFDNNSKKSYRWYLYIWSFFRFCNLLFLNPLHIADWWAKDPKSKMQFLLSVCWNFKLTKLAFTAESHSLYTRSPMWCAIHPISLCSALIIFIYA